MSEDTVIMETLKVSIIQGSINGIPQKAFESLEGKARRYFSDVRWENDVMYISNLRGDPYMGTYSEVELMFKRIAESVVEGKYGKLGFIGLVGKREIVSVLFFGHKKWELMEFKRPEAPDWYKAEEWYQRDKWREELEWEELFKRQ